MAKESATEVFRRAVKHLGPRLSPDDIAVLLGAVVELQQAADEAQWRYLRAVAAFAGIQEVEHDGQKEFDKGSLVRTANAVYVAKRSTSAPLQDDLAWTRFDGSPDAPARSLRTKRVRVLKHDARGRIAEFIETSEPDNA